MTARRCSAATSRATTRAPGVASTASSNLVPCSVTAGLGVAYAAGCPNVQRLTTGAGALQDRAHHDDPAAGAAHGGAHSHGAVRPGHRRGRGLGDRRCDRPPPLQDRAAHGTAAGDICAPDRAAEDRRGRRCGLDHRRDPRPADQGRPGERTGRAADRDRARCRRRRGRRGQRLGRERASTARLRASTPRVAGSSTRIEVGTGLREVAAGPRGVWVTRDAA